MVSRHCGASRRRCVCLFVIFYLLSRCILAQRAMAVADHFSVFKSCPVPNYMRVKPGSFPPSRQTKTTTNTQDKRKIHSVWSARPSPGADPNSILTSPSLHHRGLSLAPRSRLWALRSPIVPLLVCRPRLGSARWCPPHEVRVEYGVVGHCQSIDCDAPHEVRWGAVWLVVADQTDIPA